MNIRIKEQFNKWNENIGKYRELVKNDYDLMNYVIRFIRKFEVLFEDIILNLRSQSYWEEEFFRDKEKIRYDLIGHKLVESVSYSISILFDLKYVSIFVMNENNKNNFEIKHDIMKKNNEQEEILDTIQLLIEQFN